MGDQFAGARYFPWATQLGVFGQSAGRVAEKFIHLSCGVGVVRVDVVPDVNTILQCLGRPDKLQDKLATWARRCENCASTSSLDMPKPACMEVRAV